MDNFPPGSKYPWTISSFQGITNLTLLLELGGISVSTRTLQIPSFLLDLSLNLLELSFLCCLISELDIKAVTLSLGLSIACKRREYFSFPNCILVVPLLLIIDISYCSAKSLPRMRGEDISFTR